MCDPKCPTQDNGDVCQACIALFELYRRYQAGEVTYAEWSEALRSVGPRLMGKVQDA